MCMPFCKSLVAALLLIYGLSQALANNSPNVIYILADDLGYGDLSHAGGKAPTPHCDRLAMEGMRFTDSHTTSSVCTPTRYGIVTGRYNWRTKLKSGVLWGLSEPLIPENRLTVPKFLQQSGYHTAVIGKWHLGLGWEMLPNGEKKQAKFGPTKGDGWQIDYSKKVKGGPLSIGFNESFIIPASLDMFPYVYLKNDKATEWATVTKAFHRPGPSGENFEAINCLRDFARETNKFIDARSKVKNKPFFLYLPLTSPHTPIVPAKIWQGKSGMGSYGDFLMETDWVVGEVLKAVDRNNLAENTMIIFTADNGCSPQAKIPSLIKQGHKPNANWRGHKADIFEGGHRTPFLVRWPAKISAGTVSNQTICTTDLFATLKEIIATKQSLPNNAAEDSFSFLPALLGKTNHSTRPFTIHHSINGSFAIRRGNWKLSLCPGSGGWSAPRPNTAKKNTKLPLVQLYNLNEDPAEKNNLQAKHPKLVLELVNELAKAIKNGRSTPGVKQTNEGHPNTFDKRLLALFPVLKE